MSQQAGNRTPTARELLGFAIVFGLGTGLLEAVARGIQKYLFGTHLFLSPDIVWMAPLVDVVLFVLVAVGLLLVRKLLAVVRSAATRIGYAVMFGTFVFLIPVGPLLTTTRIGSVAALLL